MKKTLISIIILLVVAHGSAAQTIPVKVDLMSNGNKLNAFVYPTEKDDPAPAMILLHGFPGSQTSPLGMGEMLNARGVIILEFNFQGTWGSEGQFSIVSSLQDVNSAIRFLKSKEIIDKYKIDTANIAVAGFSFGGGIAMAAAIHNSQIKRIISIAGADGAVMGRKLAADSAFYKNAKEKFLKASYPPGPIKMNVDEFFSHWLLDHDNFDPVLHADSLKDKDVLLIGGWLDTSVPMEEHMIPLYRKLHDLGAEKLDVKAFPTGHYFNNSREALAETIFIWLINQN